MWLVIISNKFGPNLKSVPNGRERKLILWCYHKTWYVFSWGLCYRCINAKHAVLWKGLNRILSHFSRCTIKGCLPNWSWHCWRQISNNFGFLVKRLLGPSFWRIGHKYSSWWNGRISRIVQASIIFAQKGIGRPNHIGCWEIIGGFYEGCKWNY